MRKAALDVDIPLGGTMQGYGVKFCPPDTPMAGQNERSMPVVMQYHGKEIDGGLADRIATAGAGAAAAGLLALRDAYGMPRCCAGRRA